MDQKDIVKQLDVEFLRRTAHLLRNGRIDVQTAKKAGNDLLLLLPFQDDEDIKVKLQSFTKLYPDYEDLLVTFLNYQDQYRSSLQSEKMEQLIENKQYDEALNVVTK